MTALDPHLRKDLVFFINANARSYVFVWWRAPEIRREEPSGGSCKHDPGGILRGYAAARHGLPWAVLSGADEYAAFCWQRSCSERLRYAIRAKLRPSHRFRGYPAQRDKAVRSTARQRETGRSSLLEI